MALTLVPPVELSPKQAMTERVKKMYRQPGLLQCPRCGGRAYLTIRGGGRIVDGRIKPGTLIARYICENCYVDGRLQISMLPPEIKPVSSSPARNEGKD